VIVAISLTVIIASAMLSFLVVEAVVLSNANDKIDEMNNAG
jgi:hypothetical protein